MIIIAILSLLAKIMLCQLYTTLIIDHSIHGLVAAAFISQPTGFSPTVLAMSRRHGLAACKDNMFHAYLFSQNHPKCHLAVLAV